MFLSNVGPEFGQTFGQKSEAQIGQTQAQTGQVRSNTGRMERFFHNCWATAKLDGIAGGNLLERMASNVSTMFG